MCPSSTNTLTWTRIEKYVEIRDFVPINFSYIWITSVCIFRKCKIMYKSCRFVNFAPTNKFCFETVVKFLYGIKKSHHLRLIPTEKGEHCYVFHLFYLFLVTV